MKENIFYLVILTLIIYTASALAYLVSYKYKSISIYGRYGGIAGLFCNLLVLCIRGAIIQRLPLANGSDFLLVFAALTMALYIVYEIKAKNSGPGLYVGLINGLLFLVIVLFMGDQLKEAQPLPPVLQSPLLAIHVVTAAASYAGFALGAGVGVVQLKKGSPQDGEKWLFRIIAGSFVMLTITIIIGAVWAEQTWSRYWSWDPKETWALITWIVYAIYLHIHSRKGWKGKRANILAVVGFVIVLFTFFGVNYFLPGLHSYS